MRLLLWTLLATVGVFLSRCQAASGDSNKLVKCSLSDQLASCGRAVDIDFDYDKRFLRGESRTLQLKEDNRDEAEERGISQVAQKIADKTKQLGKKTEEIWKRIQAWYFAKEAPKLKRRFEELLDEGKSYAEVEAQWSSLLWSGWWSTPPGFKRFLRKYDDFLRENKRFDLVKKTN
ncbi:hypothetical protein F444_07479 [Phytophthora nicotianae P1976]|uniref:RxLR effector protein n=1 Tax=Phytophthora nicotianae P1976 TaxID=1317066 RepID=A0A081AEI3_PHYNI|nr:hypothetical protein F444_07479 [Phytophthora nicotianae P1976]